MEPKYWGFAVVLGPPLRRRFRGTEEEASALAQQFANEQVLDICYWDESDKSAAPGSPAITMRTVQPLASILKEKKRQREAREARKAWHR